MSTTIKYFLLLFAISSAYSQNQIITTGNDRYEAVSTNSSKTEASNGSTYNILGLTIIPPDPDKIYAVEEIEKKPEFPGDSAALQAYIKENFKNPIENGKKLVGTIFASFIIEKDGSVSEIGILHDFGHGSGDEAIRVLEKMPKWIAGKNDSNTVRCVYSMPIVCHGE